MAQFFKRCLERYGFLAAVKKGRKFSFRSRCHNVFDDPGEDKDCTIVEFFVVLLCEVYV